MISISRVLGSTVRVLGGTPIVLVSTSIVLSAQTLEQRVKEVAARGGVTWIEYQVPTIANPQRLCEAADRHVVMLERPAELRVYARLEGGRVTAVRAVTADCEVDPGAAAVVPLADIAVDDSVRWLTGLTRTLGEPPVGAIGLHAGDLALRTLIDLARNDPRPRLRGQALVWLAQRAGSEAVKTIGAAIDTDPELEVKRRAVSALSRLPRGEGVPLLIELARTHKQPEIRRQAIFWLGQSHDPRAVDFFEQILGAK